MCGIAGWMVSGQGLWNESHLAQMMAALRHRGPDDAGVYFDKKGVALGHNRLSIIDLSKNGHQPMVNQETGDVVCFNGEIFNFLEIRSELINLGFNFKSHSDTEVLLYAIAAWGMECLSKIRGMFAFAVWRPREHTLYLARDPLGIKPLYYWNSGHGLSFASEVKSLLSLPGFEVLADAFAVGQFLEFGYTFDPNRTVLRGVSKIPPGHFLRVPSNGDPELACFFKPRLDLDEKVSVYELEEELYRILSKVVEQHLISDVPIGLLLSGGLDSSVLASLAARHGPVTTLSMGFAHSTLDERPYAREVAEFIHSRHHEILIEPRQIETEIVNAITCFDDLFADFGTVTTRLLYRSCRERGLKVVIVGEGSDEILGGYSVFRTAESHAPTDWWLFQLYRLYSGRRYGSYFGEFRSIMRRQLELAGGDRFAAIRLFESCYQLPNNYISKVDRASMAESVEARVPFLDQRVVEFAYRIPQGALLASGTEKRLLRTMARRHGLLPEITLTRRKHGGSIAANWMDDDSGFRTFASETILRKGGWTEALGLRHAMEDYFYRNRQGYSFPRSISIFRNLAWRLLLLELWSSAFRVAPIAR